MDALRRAAESEMRREAPRGALGESSKRRRVNDEDDGNGDGGQGGSDGDGDGDDLSLQPQRRPWLRFAYSGASFLENESTLGFVVSSMIRKERSASREATGVLCSLLGVPEAEEEEQEEEKEEEGGKGEEEKDKGEKAGKDDDDEDEDEDKKKKKKPSGPCLTPTLSPVREREKNRGRKEREGFRFPPLFFCSLRNGKEKRKTDNNKKLFTGQARLPRAQPAGVPRKGEALRAWSSFPVRGRAGAVGALGEGGEGEREGGEGRERERERDRRSKGCRERRRR